MHRGRRHAAGEERTAPWALIHRTAADSRNRASRSGLSSTEVAARRADQRKRLDAGPSAGYRDCGTCGPPGAGAAGALGWSPCTAAAAGRARRGPCPRWRRLALGRRAGDELRAATAASGRDWPGRARIDAGRRRSGGEDRRRPGQRVRLPAAGHEARHAAAAAEPKPALGALQQDDADQREHDQEVDDDEDGLHVSKNLRNGRPAPRPPTSLRSSGSLA